MDVGSLLLSAALLFVVATFIFYPLFRSTGWRERRTTAAESLAAEREAVLAALRDLDFDHATGKIAEEDYAAQRSTLAAQGTAVLRRLDQAQTLDDELEAAVRKTRARLSLPAAAACPNCRRAYQPGDRFCGQCGAALPA